MNCKELYIAAHELQMANENIEEAINLYTEVINKCPGTELANYASIQINNINVGIESPQIIKSPPTREEKRNAAKKTLIEASSALTIIGVIATAFIILADVASGFSGHPPAAVYIPVVWLFWLASILFIFFVYRIFTK